MATKSVKRRHGTLSNEAPFEVWLSVLVATLLDEELPVLTVVVDLKVDVLLNVALALLCEVGLGDDVAEIEDSLDVSLDVVSGTVA